MIADPALEPLRSAWAYLAAPRAALELLERRAADPVIADALGRAARAYVAVNQDEVFRQMRAALVHALADALDRADALDGLDWFADARALKALRPELEARLADGDARVVTRALFLLLRSRFGDHEPLPAPDRAALRPLRAHDDAEVRALATSVLLQDAVGAERDELLRELRGLPLVDALRERTVMVNSVDVSLHRRRRSEGAPDAGATPKHVGSRCLACGSVATTTVLHEESYYSIGIIEHHEVECSECGSFTWHSFET